jgi:hypothetical protein
MFFAQATAEAVGGAVGFGVALFLALVVAIVHALIGALFVQVATKVVCQFKPSYGMAFKAVLTVAIVMFAINVVTHILNVHSTLGVILAAVGAFLVGAAIYGNTIKGPAGPVGLGRGALVSLVASLVGLLVTVLVRIATAALG